MSTIKTRGSYPHPVLDASDDVASTIEVFNPTYASGVNDVEIKFQVRMTDPGIQSLLDNGLARYSFRWTCSSTIASGELKAHPAQAYADSTGYLGWLDQEDIRGTVRLDVRIVATGPIDQYGLENQHSDYGNAHFSLLAGDILADGGYFEFEPGKLYDPLNPPVGSCFLFVSESTRKKGLTVTFHDDEHVLVTFPEKLLTGFGLLPPELQISLVVLPALMETITFIKDNIHAGDDGEDLTGKHWYVSIKRLVEDIASFEDPAFDVAQKILAQPLEASLMKSFNAPDSEDD
jgi:hypothetical protein